VNGAQTIIDQFISSAEVKWLRMSGLVMLLPHGYEGQGPEHSSARVERFLQQCAEDNMIVANCTTPANYFHILRRQLVRDYRKPLRHKKAISSMSEMDKGTMFRRVLPEAEKIAAAGKVRKVLICSGKIYYDLLDARTAKGVNDVAILRLEQFYPFPEKSLAEELKPYKNAEVVWVQEEPENMGGWTFVDRRLEAAIALADIKAKRPNVVSRRAAAATACGYMKIHTKEQQEIMDKAFA
jgi:2-oxoglutarate dehydrogenase E1 component